MVYIGPSSPKSFQGHSQMSQVFNGTKPSDHSANLCTLLFLDLLVPSALLHLPSSFHLSAWAGSLLLSSAPRWGPGTNRWARLCGPTPSLKHWMPLSWCLGGQWTQIELHVKNKVYFLEQSLINALVEIFPTWGERCPSSSSPSATSSSPSYVGLPSSASSCSSPHPWSHAVIEHVGFVFEVPRARPASHASPSYLPQLLVNLKALQTKLIHLLWCEGFK